MRLNPTQLLAHLKKPLLAAYLVEGDELFLRQEALDHLRAAAKRAGYSERQRFDVDSGVDWGDVVAAFASPSLFAPRQLTEIHWHDGKVDKNAHRALNTMTRALATDATPDNVLVLSMGRPANDVQREAWFQAIDQHGAVVSCWPLQRDALATWLTQRLHTRGYVPEPDAVALLAERVEGNLFAAAREIDALSLRQPADPKAPQPLTAAALAEAVGESARFTVYDLSDAALSGDAAAVVRIVAGLRAEGVEITLAAWALNREVQLLVRLRTAMQRGVHFDQACRQAHVFERRKPLIQKALKRLKPTQLPRLLQDAAHVDEAAKGLHLDPWRELLHLALAVAGQPLLPTGYFSQSV